MKPKQKDIDIAEWVKLDAMRTEIRNIFSSFSKTDEIPTEDINAIYDILFKKKKSN